jgi:hypothetical protein
MPRIWKLVVVLAAAGITTLWCLRGCAAERDAQSTIRAPAATPRGVGPASRRASATGNQPAVANTHETQEAEENLEDEVICSGVVLEESMRPASSPVMVEGRHSLSDAKPFCTAAANEKGEFRLVARTKRRTRKQDSLRPTTSLDVIRVIATTQDRRQASAQYTFGPAEIRERPWIVLWLRPVGVLRLRAVNPAGEPVPHGVFLVAPDPLDGARGSYAGDGVQDYREVEADDSGTVDFSCRPGLIRVWARTKDGYFGRRRDESVRLDAETQVVDVETAKDLIRTTLRIEDDSGTPIPGAAVKLQLDDAVQRFVGASDGDNLVTYRADSAGVVDFVTACDERAAEVGIAAARCKSALVLVPRSTPGAQVLRVVLEPRPKLLIRLQGVAIDDLAGVPVTATLNDKTDWRDRAPRIQVVALGDARVPTARPDDVPLAAAVELAERGMMSESTDGCSEVILWPYDTGAFSLNVSVSGVTCFAESVEVGPGENVVNVPVPPGRRLALQLESGKSAPTGAPLTPREVAGLAILVGTPAQVEAALKGRSVVDGLQIVRLKGDPPPAIWACGDAAAGALVRLTQDSSVDPTVPPTRVRIESRILSYAPPTRPVEGRVIVAVSLKERHLSAAGIPIIVRPHLADGAVGVRLTASTDEEGYARVDVPFGEYVAQVDPALGTSTKAIVRIAADHPEAQATIRLEGPTR